MIRRTLLAVIALSRFLPAAAAAQPTGALAGRVTDAQGRPLPGAPVTISAARLTGLASETGRFLIHGVRAGAHTLNVTYVGYADASREVTVRTGETVTVDVQLDVRPVELQGIAALGRIGEGQAKALTQQKNAPNVKSVSVERTRLFAA